MLKAESLHHAYPGGAAVLEDVSLELRAGRTVCLLGPNGAGKSTLLRCLLGLEKPGRGRVLIDGEDIAAHGARWRARHMAYVPQNAEGAFPFSVHDVVMMGRSAHLRFMADPGEADRRAMDDALARLQIAHLAPRQFNQLSGGERQLVLLARALAQQARILVMDEPCTGLDLGHQVQVLRAMRSLAADGYAVLLSTHLPEHAFVLDAEVALLHRRRLIGPGPAVELLTAPRLSDLYETPVELLAILDGPAAGQRACVPVV
ncbi:MAG: ABC transporter ATP-binding protein [Rubrivivax sp.]